MKTFQKELFTAMAIRKMPVELHRALHARAKKNERSAEAELRKILKDTLMSEKRIKLGTLLNSVVKKTGGLSNDEAEVFNNLRDRNQGIKAVIFE